MRPVFLDNCSAMSRSMLDSLTNIKYVRLNETKSYGNVYELFK